VWLSVSPPWRRWSATAGAGTHAKEVDPGRVEAVGYARSEKKSMSSGERFAERHLGEPPTIMNGRPCPLTRWRPPALTAAGNEGGLVPPAVEERTALFGARPTSALRRQSWAFGCRSWLSTMVLRSIPTPTPARTRGDLRRRRGRRAQTPAVRGPPTAKSQGPLSHQVDVVQPRSQAAQVHQYVHSGSSNVPQRTHPACCPAARKVAICISQFAEPLKVAPAL
jgi:hypothetical protein